jgi:hypothetical protein
MLNLNMIIKVVFKEILVGLVIFCISIAVSILFNKIILTSFFNFFLGNNLLESVQIWNNPWFYTLVTRTNTTVLMLSNIIMILFLHSKHTKIFVPTYTIIGLTIVWTILLNISMFVGF